MTDLTVQSPQPPNPRVIPPIDHHEALADAFSSAHTALLRERDRLLQRVDLLLTERAEILARNAELLRANDQKDLREAASMEREAALHAKTSHLAATVDIVHDALEKAVAAHRAAT